MSIRVLETLEHFGTKWKQQHKKNDDETRENKPESTGERRNIEKISRQDKTMHTNRTFQNKEK